MKELFTFDDVLIVPKFSTVKSRKDVDISVNVPGFPYMGLPVLSANMDTVTGSKMAIAMQSFGGQAVLHRFCTIEENVNMFLDSRIGDTTNYGVPFVSIGLGDEELHRAIALKDAGAYLFVVDVAHGAQLSVVEQVKKLRESLGSSYSIVVGNFATAESVKTFLEHTGPTVDGIKVGIGPGSACSTRIKTGVGYPQLSAIIEIVNILKNIGVPVIADGGLSTPGSIAKAIGAGASMVMLGRMLAGTHETPGDVEDILNVLTGEYDIPSKKQYSGSASKESYATQNKDASWRTAEGESLSVPYKGFVKDVLKDIEGGLRSAMSYVGAHNIKEFQNKVEFVKVSNSTVIENGVRK